MIHINEIKNYFSSFKIITQASIKKFLTINDIQYIRKKYYWCLSDREIIFCILNDIEKKPICALSYCENTVVFERNKYKHGCCGDHNRRITNLEKFGAEHNWAKETESRKKFQKTMQEKYGATSTLGSLELKEKVKNTVKEKYGVDNVFQSEEIKEKSKQTCLEKYGVENPQQNKEIKNKSLKTFKKKTKEIAEKRKKTLFEKYGVHNPNQIGKKEWFIFRQKPIDEIKTYFEKYSMEELMNFFNVSSFPLRILHSELFGKSSKLRLETNIVSFIKSILPNEEILINTRKIISPLEVDIYVPNRKIAIEFNGVYWHSELRNTDKKYHLNKTELCDKKGIRLIHIFDSEWLFNKNKIKLFLTSLFNKNKKRIYGKECIIKNVNKDDKKKFLEEYHLQGNDKSLIHIGLYYDNELIQLITFSKPKFNIKYEWEISRFVTKNDIIVVGGMEKLFKYFIKINNPLSIISYSDRRFFNGKSYEMIGMTKLENTPPNFYYFHFDKKLVSSIGWQKHKLQERLHLYNKNISEWENMQLNGYSRIWDCGNFKFEWLKK